MVGMTSVVVTVMIVIGCMTIMTDSISRLMGLVCFFFMLSPVSSFFSCHLPFPLWNLFELQWKQLVESGGVNSNLYATSAHP